MHSPRWTNCKYLIGLFALISVLHDASAHEAVLPLPIRQIHEVSNPLYLNDILVRTNGDLLMTTIWPNGSVYSVRNPSSESPEISTVVTGKGINSITSIYEVEPNLFQCLGGTNTIPGMGVESSFSIWELDLRNSAMKPALRQLVHLQDIGLAAAIVPIPNHANKVLVVDSKFGTVSRIDTSTGLTEIIMRDPTMQPPVWAPIPVGVAHALLHKGYLYYSLIFDALVYRIRLTEDGYLYPGASPEIQARIHSISADGLTMGPGGVMSDDMWVSTDADNRLAHISPDGNVTWVLGAPDEQTVLGCTGLAFGKKPGEEMLLYMTTNGGINNPLEGSYTEGGRLVVVDTAAFYRSRSAVDAPHGAELAPKTLGHSDNQQVLSGRPDL